MMLIGRMLAARVKQYVKDLACHHQGHDMHLVVDRRGTVESLGAHNFTNPAHGWLSIEGLPARHCVSFCARCHRTAESYRFALAGE